MMQEKRATAAAKQMGKLMSEDILADAKKLYRPGMTKEQFAEQLFPGLFWRKAPPWAHKLLDIIWDFFTKKEK